jgi:D-cysteine desulfhydrase
MRAKLIILAAATVMVACIVGVEAPPSAGAVEHADFPLFRRYPGLAVRLHRVRLAQLPTPVEPAAALARAIGVARLHIKRDDLSARAYGGGKPRKLELLLGTAQAAGSSEVLTFGGVGSHHALATSIFARQLGLRTTLILLPQPPSAEVRKTLLACHKQGARLESAGSQRAAIVRARARSHGALTVIETGGSSPLGNVGFVNAGIELAEQIAAGALPEPDDIYIPLGTMGSAAGLVIGLRAAGVKSRVVAVRASNRGTSSRGKLDAMISATLSYLRLRDPQFPALTIDETDIVIDGSQLGKGYALPTERARRAAALYRQHTGQQLELTYTAKSFAAVAAAEDKGRSVLFWNTHSARPIDSEGVDPAALPRPFRAYFPAGLSGRKKR